MGNSVTAGAQILQFRKRGREQGKVRKVGLNKNREGSVRKINGQAYVDFVYMDERVREPSGLDWDEKNARLVREQLDKIIVSIKSGTFRFGEVFTTAKRGIIFEKRRSRHMVLKRRPIRSI